MSRKLMDELYEELNQIGLTFTEQEVRFASQMVVGLYDFSVCGTLRNINGDVFIMERMAEVFAIAEKKVAFLFIKPGERYGKTTLAVCFMQKGLFDTIYNVRPVNGTLKRNFWYFQEDAAALRLHGLLKRFTESVDRFLKNPHGLHTLYSDSYAIERLVNDHVALFRKEEICYYMETDIQRAEVERLYEVLTCLKVAC